MELVIGFLVVVALGFGVWRILRSRATKHADRQARADKRTKDAKADAHAIKRTLDSRR
jgi:type VI protein secretion system component VasK